MTDDRILNIFAYFMLLAITVSVLAIIGKLNRIISLLERDRTR